MSHRPGDCLMVVKLKNNGLLDSELQEVMTFIANERTIQVRRASTPQSRRCMRLALPGHHAKVPRFLKEGAMSPENDGVLALMISYRDLITN